MNAFPGKWILKWYPISCNAGFFTRVLTKWRLSVSAQKSPLVQYHACNPRSGAKASVHSSPSSKVLDYVRQTDIEVLNALGHSNGIVIPSQVASKWSESGVLFFRDRGTITILLAALAYVTPWIFFNLTLAIDLKISSHPKTLLLQQMGCVFKTFPQKRGTTEH